MIRIDEKLVEQARHTDMLAFLEKYHGFTFTHQGGVYRCKQHKSLAVKDDRLSWYWHSKGVGGFGAIDYLTKIESLSFRQAVETVTDIPAAVPTCQTPPDKQLVLPEKGGMLQNRLRDYLCNKRGIDIAIVGALLDEGKIYEDRRGNVVFVGADENGKPQFASLRGTSSSQAAYRLFSPNGEKLTHSAAPPLPKKSNDFAGTPKQFRMDCAGSDKRYGFHIGTALSERLYIFESPIDAMSHACIENIIVGDRNAWQRDNCLSLAGTSDTALPEYLKQHTQAKELVLCLDNDEPGRGASIAIARKYAGQGYRTRIELPTAKDYNVELKNMLEKLQLQQAQKNVVKLHKKMAL